MNQIIVGVGECKSSNNPNEIIKTYALGSCVALIVYERERKIAGMVHIALPDSSTSEKKSKILPGYFANTGIPKLLTEIKILGAEKRLTTFKLAGGARINDPDSFFDIGKRNILAVRKILWKFQIGLISEDVGKNYSRTVSINVATGEIIITSGGSGGKTWTL